MKLEATSARDGFLREIEDALSSKDKSVAAQANSFDRCSRVSAPNRSWRVKNGWRDALNDAPDHRLIQVERAVRDRRGVPVLRQLGTGGRNTVVTALDNDTRQRHVSTSARYRGYRGGFNFRRYNVSRANLLWRRAHN